MLNKKESEFDNFNKAMDSILKADPKAVRADGSGEESNRRKGED
jgi:hypothetical protein